MHLWKCYKYMLEKVGGICVFICKEEGSRQTGVVRLTQSENRKSDEEEISAFLTPCRAF